ncbi:MAG: hypothetical protein EB037_04045 [Actinobacteria bacterium]|nr:hypothetical protein [Actinomycetota bacterium]
MSELIFELLLRLLRVAAAALIGLLIYVAATAIDPTAAGATLGVASFAAGAGAILLLESSPL